MTSKPNDLAAARQRIAAAYDPTVLEAAGCQLISVLTENFRSVESREVNVLSWNPPAGQVQHARSLMDDPRAHIPLPLREGPGEGSVLAALANRLAILTRDSLARGQ